MGAGQFVDVELQRMNIAGQEPSQEASYPGKSEKVTRTRDLINLPHIFLPTELDQVLICTIDIY